MVNGNPRCASGQCVQRDDLTPVLAAAFVALRILSRTEVLLEDSMKNRRTAGAPSVTNYCSS